MFFLRQNWKRVTLLAALMLLVPPFTNQYAVVYMVVPIIFFLDEMKKFTLHNATIMLLLLGTMVPLALGERDIFPTLNSYYNITLTTFIEGLSLIGLSVLLTIEGLSDALRKVAGRRRLAIDGTASQRVFPVSETEE